ncbi:hypothetical protein ACOSQ3_003864 [Xanthoceras sorbifolium]
MRKFWADLLDLRGFLRRITGDNDDKESKDGDSDGSSDSDNGGGGNNGGGRCHNEKNGGGYGDGRDKGSGGLKGGLKEMRRDSTAWFACSYVYRRRCWHFYRIYI